MNKTFTLTLLAASTLLITACGGSGGGNNGDNKTTPPNTNSTVIFENGIQDIRAGYTPLRLNIVNLRDEQASFMIGLPTAGGNEGEYTQFIKSDLSQAHPNLLQTEWKNGNDHSIQIKNTKFDTALDVKITDLNMNNPWQVQGQVTGGDEEALHILILPRVTDIEGQVPVAFIDGNLDFDDMRSEGHISFVNRFHHSTLSAEESNICLAVIDENDSVLLVEDNLEQSEATELVAHTALGQSSMKRLVVVTHTTLNHQNLFRELTPEQLQAIDTACPNHIVGNGENMWVIDVAARISAMTTDIIYSPTEGEIARFATTATLPSLKWTSEIDYQITPNNSK